MAGQPFSYMVLHHGPGMWHHMNGPSKSDCRNQELGYKISAQSGCCFNIDKNLGPTGDDHVLKKSEREKCSTQTDRGMEMERIPGFLWHEGTSGSQMSPRLCCRANPHTTDDVATLPTSLTAVGLIIELKWLTLGTWMRFGTVSKRPLQSLRTPILIQFFFFWEKNLCFVF